MCQLGINNTCNVKLETKEDVRQTKNKLTCLGRNNDFIGLSRHCYIIVQKTFIYFAPARLGSYNYTYEFHQFLLPASHL